MHRPLLLIVVLVASLALVWLGGRGTLAQPNQLNQAVEAGDAAGQPAGAEPPTPASESLGLDRQSLLGAPQGPPRSGAELDLITEELASRMRCPKCQALSIADSPSISAMAMKDEVRELLAEGYTEEQVIVYFERAYGEFIRLEPKPQGFNLVVWFAPAAALVVGGAIVALYLRRRSSQPADAPTAPPDPEIEAYRERVRREVEAQ